MAAEAVIRHKSRWMTLSKDVAGFGLEYCYLIETRQRTTLASDGV